MRRYIYFHQIAPDDRYKCKRDVYHFLAPAEARYYPDFQQWYYKLFNGDTLKPEREIIMRMENGGLAGVAITKYDPFFSKICTLYVAKGYRRKGIGSDLMRRAIKCTGDEYPLFSIDKTLVNDYLPILKQYHFEIDDVGYDYYRRGATEYAYNKPLENTIILLSIKPKYAEQILAGSKVYEFRKRVPRYMPDYMYIYSSFPTCRVTGCAKVESIIVDSPDLLWKKTYKYAGISKEAYDKYFTGTDQAYAYVIGKVVGFPVYKELSELGIERPPQNFVYIENWWKGK